MAVGGFVVHFILFHVVGDAVGFMVRFCLIISGHLVAFARAIVIVNDSSAALSVEMI